MSFQQWVVRGTQEPAPLPHWFAAYLVKFVVELTGSAAMASVATIGLHVVAMYWNPGFLADLGAALGFPGRVASPFAFYTFATAVILERLMWCTLTDHARGQ